jgi:Zn-dependent protease
MTPLVSAKEIENARLRFMSASGPMERNSCAKLAFALTPLRETVHMLTPPMPANATSIVAQAVMVLVPMILSLTLHEYAHALVANRLGDRTAEEQGRLTLNPVSHIDPVGTLFLPLMLLIAAGTIGGVPFFGWAKPVPYNPNRFNRNVKMRTGAMLVAAAGPVSNFSFALVLTVGYGLAHRFGVEISDAVNTILKTMIGINIGLAIFNLIPLPPLDGAKVLLGFLPLPQAQAYEAFMARAGFFILIGLVAFGGRVLYYPMSIAYHFLLGIVLPIVAGVS